MMFKAHFQPGIVGGGITTTFRYWKRPQAKAGGLQKIGTMGYIAVDAVEVVEARAIKPDDARRAGFTSLRELHEYLAPMADEDRTLYRIDFTYVGHRPDREPDRTPAGTDDEIAAIDKALDLRDRNSKCGPWTRQTLALVGEYPGMSSKELASRLGRDRAALKQDMRKLKKLGLTESLETGYRLSARGESYINRA